MLTYEERQSIRQMAAEKDGERKKYSQKEIAAMTYSSVRTVQRVLNGK